MLSEDLFEILKALEYLVEPWLLWVDIWEYNRRDVNIRSNDLIEPISQVRKISTTHLV
jgi:hypothetical protein